VSDRNLLDCNPVLVARFTAVKHEYEATYPDCTLVVICTRRTTEEQQAEYAKGRTAPLFGAVPRPLGKKVTDKDGLVLKSKHQAQADGLAAALDFAVFLHDGLKSTPTWVISYYRPVGSLAKAAGLRWGGTWGDFDHLELA
jgi:hypothetical protein